MKTIDISTQKYPGFLAQVDDEDFPIQNQWKWHPKKHGKTFYAFRTSLTGRGGQITIYMHISILGMPKGTKTDHEDGNGLNNQRNNLRPATCAENAANRRRRSDNKSGFIGVSWHKQAKKWRPEIVVNGKRISLGLFHDPKEAANVRDIAAAKHHGKFAKLNFSRTVK